MKGDKDLPQWQQLMSSILNAATVKPDFPENLDVGSTTPSEAPAEHYCVRKIAQLEHQVAILCHILTDQVKDAHELRNDLDDWIAAIDVQIAHALTRNQ